MTAAGKVGVLDYIVLDNDVRSADGLEDSREEAPLAASWVCGKFLPSLLFNGIML